MKLVLVFFDKALPSDHLTLGPHEVFPSPCEAMIFTATRDLEAGEELCAGPWTSALAMCCMLLSSGCSISSHLKKNKKKTTTRNQADDLNAQI